MSVLTPSVEDGLAQLAKLSVRSGVNLKPGQELIVGADVADASFARLVAKEAYEAGAKRVVTLFGDEETDLIRYRYGSDEAIAYAPSWQAQAVAGALRSGAAFLRVYGSDPELLKGVDPQKVAISSRAQEEASYPAARVLGEGKANWSIIPVASEPWARMVFPHERAETAIHKLWEAIFFCTYADTSDPVGQWLTHCREIEVRRDQLNCRRFEALRFFGGGTDLTIGLVERHVWVGGRATLAGMECCPNIPTEEVFTMPHRDRAEGTVRITKPLSLRGVIVEGAVFEFVDGKVVQAQAEKGEQTLLDSLDMDEGARRLGEVALVPADSRVGSTGLLFFNTLFDENAASHMAIGRAIDMNLPCLDEASESEREALGVNSSRIHIDWMIGSEEVSVDGVADGQAVPVMRDGLWVLSG